MTAQHSIALVRKDLIEALSRNDQELTLDESYLDDYAKIGSLLTDKASCITQLAKINTALLTKVNQLDMRQRRLKFRKKRLVTAEFEYSYQTKEETKRQVFPTTRGLLANFLGIWEEQQGFNQEVQQEGGGLPARTPELTEFVGGNDFRKYLLKHGFHWVDTAVGGSHGEFTHRLHWYIVCNHFSAPNALNHTPLKLFKKCGEPEACHPKATAFIQAKDTVWDQIFDNGRTTGTRENYFRCPENLHAFLRLEATQKQKNLWVLAQMVDTRALMAQSIGKNDITSDYQAFEQKHIDDVVLRGDKTGMGGDTPGTIMWRDLNENPAFWRRL